jgi:HEAT repeat protein
MRAIGLTSVLGLWLCWSGCQATPEKINTWKGTQKGPGKLREVVQDGSAEPQLRGLAFAALVEIGMAQDAEHDLATAPPTARAAITHEAIAPLLALLGESLQRPTTPTTSQRGAKDALFVLRGSAGDSDRAEIDRVLLKWTTLDLAGRSMLGGESSEKILRAIGPTAAPALLPFVRVGPDLVFAAKLIGELGDAETRNRAAGSLIALTKGDGRAASDPLLQAIGLIGGDEATQFLLQLAHTAATDTRAKALYALSQGKLSAGNDKALAGALEIAADTKAPGQVREAAFDVAERLGPAAVGALVKLLTDHDSTVRWRAIEAALKAGGAAAIPRVLPALAEDRPVKSEDLDSYVVHDLTQIGRDGLPQLTALVQQAGAGLGRIAAIRALGRLGGASEAAVLARVAGDPASKTPAHALVPATTVEAEANGAKLAIGKRGR